MRPASILALALAVAACAPAAPPPLGSPEAGRIISDRAVVIGQHMRAALSCGVSVPTGAQDRAATIESAALTYQQAEGGAVARDAWLQAIAPPAMTPRRLVTWCDAHRPDIDRIIRWLDGAEGEAFATRAAEVQRR
jgi:hypothetical protein